MTLETAAYRELAAATVVAPVTASCFSLNAEVGIRSAADTVVATLGDLSQLALVVNVAEADVTTVGVGQTVGSRSMRYLGIATRALSSN